MTRGQDAVYTANGLFFGALGGDVSSRGQFLSGFPGGLGGRCRRMLRSLGRSNDVVPRRDEMQPFLADVDLRILSRASFERPFKPFSGRSLHAPVGSSPAPNR
jgi:hypothetical protein